MNFGLQPLLDLTSLAATDPTVSGGVAGNLAQLARAGLRVPPGFVVTTAAYRQHVAACAGLRGILATSADAGPDAAAIARARLEIAGQPLPAGLADALRPRLAALLMEGPLILRPSPTWPRPAGRPEPELSASRPNVASVEDALAALPQVFAALWQPVDTSFAPPVWDDGVAMAVIVQICLRCQVEGVASPMSPGEEGKPLALRLRGAGNERGTTQFIALPDGELLAGEAHGRARLPAAQARLLASAYRQAEDRLGFPQDLSWAVAGGEIFILGSRPVSRLPERWLRAPMAERFPQPLSPLTWDLLADGYEQAFDRATQELGLPPMAVRWLSCTDGWVRINQAAVELCLAPLERRWSSLAELERGLPEWAERFGWVQDLPTAWLADMDRYLLQLGRLTSATAEVGSVGELWRRLEALRSLGLDFFRHHGRVELAGLSLRRQLLRLLREVAGPDLATNLMQDLLLAPDGRMAGLRADFKALRRLAHRPEARDWLASPDARAAWQAGPPAAAEELGQRLDALLADHGHLSARYDLAEPTWSEEPWRLMRLLAEDEHPVALMPFRRQQPEQAQEQDQRVRRGQAEARLMALIPTGLRVFTLELVRLTRLYQDLPELERYQVRRMAPALRRNLLALGEQMRQSGALADATDVFQLGLSELGAWIQTACPTAQRPGARRGPGPESLLAPPREASGA